MKVSHLLPEVISRLRSGIAITSCSHAIEELVLNAIDAGATCVAVRLNLPFFKLQVIDNGVGIPSEFFNLIGERYATSKCHSLEDLRNIKTGGFRGEALSSLVDVSSIVEIVSCSSISNKTFCKIFKQGKSLPSTESKIRRPSKGTTVTIFDFMYNLPVRKNCISEILDVEQCRKCLEIISLMHPHISFSLRNDSTGDICLQTRKCYSTLRVFAQLFGQVKANSMKEVSFSHGKYRIEGYINCDGHISKDLQFLYINKRHILKTKLHKLINTILNKAMFTRQKINIKVKDNAPTPNTLLNSPSKKQIRYNIFVLDISCPYDEYDIILEPRKTLVEFENWGAVIELVQKALFNFLQNQNFLCSPVSTDFLASSFDVFGSTSIINNHNNHEEQAVIPEKFGKGINAQNVKNGLFSAVVKRLPPVTNEKKNNVSKLNFDSESYTAIEENCGKEPTSPLISKKFLNSICQEGTSDSSSIGKSLYIKSYDTELDNNVKGTSDSECTRYSDLNQTSCELRHSFIKPVTLPFSLENDGDINDCYKRRNAAIEEMQNVKFGAVRGHKVANHNDINSYQMTLSEQYSITTKHPTGSQILNLGSSSFGACCDKMQCTCVHGRKIPTVVCKEVCKDQQSVFLTKPPIKLKFPVESSISKFEKLLSRKRAHVENNDMKVVDAFDHKKPFSHIQVPNVNPIKLRIPVKTSLTYLEKYSKKSEVLGQLKNAFQYCSQTGHRTLANDMSYKQTDDQMKLTMYTQSREIKKKKIIGLKEICNVKKGNPFDKYSLSKVNHKSKSLRQISSRFPINQDFAFGANGKGTKQLSTTFCDKVFGLSLNKAKLLSGCNSQNIITVTDSPENSGNCSEPCFISNCTSETGFTETCAISKPHSNVNGLGFKDVASKFHDCSEVFMSSLNEMNGNYCRAKILLPTNDSPKCLESDAPKACESETIPDNMECEYEIFLGNREYPQITSSSVECSDCHESNRTKDNLNSFQQHISEESITSNSLIPEAVIGAECSTVNSKTTFPNQCNNLPSTVVNKIFDSKYITTLSLGLKCSEQQKALQENINLCDNSEDFFISLPVKSNENNTSENTKNFQCPTQKHSNISISSCNHMSARDQSKKSSQETCIASLLDNVINEVSMIHANDDIKKRFSCKQTSTATEADITHFSHSVSGHSDSSGSLINDTKLHPSELCYNNFDEQLNVSNVNLSESEREISHNSKITSRPLNNVHPQSSEEIFQKNSECTGSKAALVKKARWLCKKDPVTGKCVYFDSITGNSTYNLPLEYKHVQQTIQQNKHCYQSDISCIAEENCSHFFLSHDSTPFMARPPKLRKNKVYRSEEERNLQSECNSSELQDDLDIHIKDQDTNEISEKWREGKPVSSDNRVEELFSCWENPMFTKSDAEVLTVPSTSSNSQNQPKMYTILNSYRFSRVAFPHLQVLGQVDCKFIACIIQDVNENMKGKKLLVLFDQHAVHERIRLEQLIEDMYEVNPMNEKVVKSTALSPPLVLLLKPEEIRLLKAYQNRIKSLGIKLSFEKDMLEIKVHAVPTCLIKRESSELKRKRQPVTSLVVERILQEWLMSLEQTRGGNSIIPKTLSAVLNSQACRGAIKFGDPLDITQCKQLLKALAECKLPFQCAHGRPSLAPLLDLQKICHLDEKMPKLQLWKLKAKVKGD